MDDASFLNTFMS